MRTLILLAMGRGDHPVTAIPARTGQLHSPDGARPGPARPGPPGRRGHCGVAGRGGHGRAPAADHPHRHRPVPCPGRP